MNPLALRNEPFPDDPTDLYTSRWGVARLLRSRTTGRTYIAYVVDDGIDPTAYVVSESEDVYWAQEVVEGINRSRDSARGYIEKEA